VTGSTAPGALDARGESKATRRQHARHPAALVAEEIEVGKLGRICVLAGTHHPTKRSLHTDQ
jgi:hypothetical protein